MKKYIALLLTLTIVMSCVIPMGAVMAADGENLALGKPVSAVSEWGGAYLNVCVNDGKMDTAWSPGTTRVAPKDSDGNDWIMIDLGALYDITSMIAYSRSDVNSASERLGWIYQVSETSDFEKKQVIGVKNNPGTPGQGYEVTLKKPVTGRYVRVACPQYFVIAEIEVYGSIALEKAKGEFTDIAAEGDLYNASQIAYALGIMEGTSNSEFGVGYLMTRGEAAEAAAKLQVSGELDLAETGYSDVPYEHEKSGYIAWCENAGIISKASEFRPDDFITGTEFVTMLMRLSGWYSLVQGGEYPTNVINAAQKIKLTKGVDMDLSAKLNKSRAILLIYNMLLSEMAIPVKVNEYGAAHKGAGTYMEEVFEYTMYEGVVETTEHTGLVEAVGTNRNFVGIDGVMYKDSKGVASAYLGENVYFLVDKKDTIIYMWRNPDIGTRKTVMCSDIKKSDSTSIIYYDVQKDKEERLGIESQLYFIKNGAASGDYRPTDLKRTNGKLVLIDNDNNRKIDVIKLYEPQVIVMDYIGVDENRLSIGAQNGDTLEVPSFETLIVTKGGLPMPYAEIQTGSLIYAYVSDDGKHVEVEVSMNSVSGTIDTIADDEIVIDGISYGFSDYYTVNAAIMDEIVVGSKAKFLLDDEGLIVWAVNESVVSEGETLSVILATSETTGFRTMKFRVFNEMNEMVTLTCASKVRVDGTNMGMSQIASLGSSYFVGKAAIYRLNSNGLVTYINTETYVSGAEKLDNLHIRTDLSLPSGSGRAITGFYADDSKTMVMPVYEDFPVLTVAEDSVTGELLHDDEYKAQMSYSTINTLYPSSSDVYSKGTFTFYGDEDKPSPDFAVRVLTINTNANVGAMSAYTSNSTMIVDRVAVSQTAGGESAYNIYGYNAASGAELKITTSPMITRVIDSYGIYNNSEISGISFTGLNYINVSSSTGLDDTCTKPINELSKGDIIRYELTSSQATALERIYCVTDTVSTDHVGDILNTGDNYLKIYRAGYRAYSGTIDTVGNSIMKINMGENLESFNYLKSSVVKFVVVDDGEINSYDTGLLPMYASQNDKVFVVSLSGKVSYIVVYK